MDARRQHARWQARRAYRVSRPAAGGNAMAATRISRSAMVNLQTPHVSTTLPLDAIWLALAAVPDPEIPVISVVDLGIVRDVQWFGDELVVTVTPTYSGCPATEVIATDISRALASAGVERHRIETRLAPAWTTDWIAPDARHRLRDYGIAPPGQRVDATVWTIDVSGLRRRRNEIDIPCP